MLAMQCIFKVLMDVFMVLAANCVHFSPFSALHWNIGILAGKTWTCSVGKAILNHTSPADYNL